MGTIEIPAIGLQRTLQEGIRLSTLDRGRYQRDRGGDHLELVLRNLDHAKDKPVAQDMDIVVEVGKVSGSQTYRESLTVPPMELPQRSPM